MPDYVIGMMSGSSLDGLDMALCRLDHSNDSMNWEILKSQTIPYPSHIRLSLESAPSLSGFELEKLNAEFGRFIGIETRKWIEMHQLQADYIASHGHTVFHEPGLGFTTQIGSGAHIAFESGLDTITSFRSADIAAGGQGAPFAPVADKALFPGYDAYLNLGGIANVNLISKDDHWHAWDIGPCNQALNFLANKLGKSYDEDGKLASQGQPDEEVIAPLLAMYPFKSGKPKGLSNLEVYKTWVQYLQSSNVGIVDLLASVTEAVARMIVNHISPMIKSPSKILVTGGGAHNRKLISAIGAKAVNMQLLMQFPSKEVIDHKESLLMAYLGYLTMNNKPYGISTVTGAQHDTIGGAIFKAYR